VRLSIDDALDLDVRGDGRGLPPKLRAGVGMTSMRERATELGGTCTIASEAGGGTRVHARLPVHEEVQWIPSAR
jgi:two-component system, NarL family, sensor kinase